LGIILFVRCTPVVWISKWQGSVQASTYGAEFNAMFMAIEEILSIRYSLCSFGVPVNQASNVFGNNMSMLFNIQQPDSQLRKKHLAISYHVTHKSCAANIVQRFYIPCCSSASTISNVFSMILVPMEHVLLIQTSESICYNLFDVHRFCFHVLFLEYWRGGWILGICPSSSLVSLLTGA
jgi:hypothetical protein